MGHRFQLLRAPAQVRLWREQGLTHLLRSAPQALAAADATPRAEADAGIAHAAPDMPAEPASAPWPEPWAGWLGRVKRPCRILWTYLLLAQDYQSPSAERRDLWRRLLAQVPWKGVSGFLPLAEPGPDGPLARPQLFGRAVAELDVRVVLCFGQDAAALLPAEAELHGARLLVLPGPGDLLLGGEALGTALAALESLTP